jgi:hypothetical protein
MPNELEDLLDDRIAQANIHKLEVLGPLTRNTVGEVMQRFSNSDHLSKLLDECLVPIDRMVEHRVAWLMGRQVHRYIIHNPSSPWNTDI